MWAKLSHTQLIPPVRWSIAFLVVVTIGHWTNGHWFWGKQFISQIKHGIFPPLGWLAFLILSGLLAYMSWRCFTWKQLFFSCVYALTSLLSLGLLITADNSTLHQKLYVWIIALPAVSYLILLLRNGRIRPLCAYIFALLMAVPAASLDPVYGQKVCVILFLLFMCYHYLELWARNAPDEDLEPPHELIELRQRQAEEAATRKRNRIKQKWDARSDTTSSPHSQPEKLVELELPES